MEKQHDGVEGEMLKVIDLHVAIEKGLHPKYKRPLAETGELLTRTGFYQDRRRRIETNFKLEAAITKEASKFKSEGAVDESQRRDLDTALSADPGNESIEQMQGSGTAPEWNEPGRLSPLIGMGNMTTSRPSVTSSRQALVGAYQISVPSAAQQTTATLPQKATPLVQTKLGPGLVPVTTITTKPDPVELPADNLRRPFEPYSPFHGQLDISKAGRISPVQQPVFTTQTHQPSPQIGTFKPALEGPQPGKPTWSMANTAVKPTPRMVPPAEPEIFKPILTQPKDTSTGFSSSPMLESGELENFSNQLPNMALHGPNADASKRRRINSPRQYVVPSPNPEQDPYPPAPMHAAPHHASTNDPYLSKMNPAPLRAPVYPPGAYGGPAPKHERPEYERPEPERVIYGRPEYERPEFGRPEFGRPEYERPEFGRPEFKRPDYERPGFGRLELGTEYERPNFARPEFGRPEYERPGPGRPEFGRPDFGRSEYERLGLRGPEYERPASAHIAYPGHYVWLCMSIANHSIRRSQCLCVLPRPWQGGQRRQTTQPTLSTIHHGGNGLAVLNDMSSDHSPTGQTRVHTTMQCETRAMLTTTICGTALEFWLQKSVCSKP